MRNRQAPATGCSHRDRVLGIRERDDCQANEERHGASRAHGVLLEDLFERSDLGHGHFLTEGSVFDHVPVFLGHELIKARSELYVIETHGLASLIFEPVATVGHYPPYVFVS